MKEFTTAAAAPKAEGQEEVGQPVSIKLDGKQITFKAPESKVFLILMSIYAEMDSGNQLLALGSAVNMMFNLLEPADRAHMKRRLFDPDDPMGEEEIMGIFRHLIGEWSGRPTESPSDLDSPPSVSTDASTVTQSLADSIPSTFGQTGS